MICVNLGEGDLLYFGTSQWFSARLGAWALRRSIGRVERTMTKAGNRSRQLAGDPCSSLVSHMMTPGVVQIPGDISVSEAALLLEKEQVPCLLVKDSETRFGLMTPTDIVKKVVAQGLEPEDVEVRSIMSKPVRFIEYDAVIEEASSLMASAGVSLLIVTQQNQPVGVLTARDLVLAPQRCQTRLAGTVSLLDGEEPGAKRDMIITQLSHVGATVESRALLLPGTNILLSFAIPGLNGPFVTQGRVLSCDAPPASRESSARPQHPGVDIQFTNLSPPDQARIRAWVQQQLLTPPAHA